MTGGTIAWGITFAVLLIATGITIGWPIGHARGLKHAAEDDAEAAYWQPADDDWNRLADEPARPAPVRPPAPPQAPHAGPGKHRHPAGPRHAELPAAGYLPAEPGPWNATITLPAPAQSPPWDLRPVRPAPEPPTQVLEPTAADCLRPDALTDTGWTRQEARRLAQEMDRDIERMEQDMDAWIAERIGATDSTLKAITK